MFFGALLSAIKSCASATLLAPSVTFAENILRPYFRHLDDRRFLRVMQAVVLGFTTLVTLFALNSHLSIFHMVENAYKVTLVSSFVPLAFGLFWKPATRRAAGRDPAGAGVTAGVRGVLRRRGRAAAAGGAAVLGRRHGVGLLLPQWIGDHPRVKEVHIA